MFHSIILHYRHYKSLGLFYVHSLLRLVGTSLFDIFSSIFIFQVFLKNGFSNVHAVSFSLLFFSFASLSHFCSLSLFIKTLPKNGLKLSMFWGNIFLLFFYLFLLLAGYNIFFLIFSFIFYGLYAAFYWMGYHIYFTYFCEDKKQGEEVGMSNILGIIASVIGPVLGGITITAIGFTGVFMLLLLLLFIANLPLIYLPKEKVSFGKSPIKDVYINAVFHDKKATVAIFSLGIISISAVTIWPLFIFPILQKYTFIGFMGSLSSLMSALIAIILGIAIDRFGLKKLLNISGFFNVIMWELAAWVMFPIQVFIVSILQATTVSGQTMISDSLIYRRARHKGVFTTIFQRELNLALSKFIFMLFISVMILFGLSLRFTFFFTAVISLFTIFYPTNSIKNK